MASKRVQLLPPASQAAADDSVLAAIWNPKTTFGLFAIVSTATVLLGATAYYISCKIRSPKRRAPASRRDVID